MMVPQQGIQKEKECDRRQDGLDHPAGRFEDDENHERAQNHLALILHDPVLVQDSFEIDDDI